MEVSEEISVHKLHTVEDNHTPQQQLGLGFQPPDDLDQQTTDEELQNPQIVNQELLQNQQTLSEELQNQEIFSEEELQNRQVNNEELQNQQFVNQELLQKKEILSEELQNQEIVVSEEELQNRQVINEELQKLVLEEKENVSEKGVDREDDVDGAESESNENVTDRKVDGEGEDKNENDDAKVEQSTDDVNVNDDDDRSENENVGGESVLGSESKDGRYRKYHSHPERPDAEDCSYYMRTGTCKFGLNCKFNHPPRKRNQTAKEKVKENEENPERPGQIECKYYLTSGGCKFGKACRYNHSRGRTPVAPIAPIVEFNFLGLPIRLGEKECPFYMRNGSCKYGSNCRFNHPDPTALEGGDTLSGYGNGGSISLQGASQSTLSSWSPRALNETAPFVPVMFSPTQGVPSSHPDWNGYQAPVYPTPERSLPIPPAFTLNSPAETNFYMHHKQQMFVDEFPERPGQPECSYFLKTGNCKYRSGCKFHHPKNRMLKTAECSLSDKGLPLRPDQDICSHYTRYGICKFGPACRFDHPVNYGHSTSAAVSGPDKPSPFCNSATTDGPVENGWE